MTFYLANTSQMKKKVDIVNSKEFNIYDMDKINDILHEKEDVDLCIEGGYRSLAKGAPFASGFVLYQYNIVENPQDCDYLLSTKKTKHTLTPNNEFHFLYHKLEKP